MAKRGQPIRVLVTGGPTRAYLDRVRFLSNISTGELAFHICQSLCKKGVEVSLVVGPSSFPFYRLPTRRLIAIETTNEMRQAVLRLCRSRRFDFAVFASAVLDFEPTYRRRGKVSSAEKSWVVSLRPTRKIIDEVGQRFPRLKRIGFKLEWSPTSPKICNQMARKIVKDKGLEALCLNFLSTITRDRHPAFLYGRHAEPCYAKTKREIASWLTNYILGRYSPKTPEASLNRKPRRPGAHTERACCKGSSR